MKAVARSFVAIAALFAAIAPQYTPVEPRSARWTGVDPISRLPRASLSVGGFCGAPLHLRAGHKKCRKRFA